MSEMQLKSELVRVVDLNKYAQSIVRIIKDNYDFEWLIGSVYTSPLVVYYIQSLSSSINDCFYGIYDKKKMIGFIHLKQLYDYIHINNIAVNKKNTCCGCGTSLLDRAINESSVKRKKLRLHVDCRNKTAINWYFNKNFRVLEENYYSLLCGKKNIGVESIKNFFFNDNSANFEKYGFSFGYIFYKDFKIKVGFVAPSYIKIIDHHYLSDKDIVNMQNEIECNLVVPRKLIIRKTDNMSIWSIFTMEYNDVGCK